MLILTHCTEEVVAKERKSGSIGKDDHAEIRMALDDRVRLGDATVCCENKKNQ